MTNTVIGFAVIWVARNTMGMGDATSNACGYVVALAFSFIFNSRWSFSFQGDHLASLLKFLAVFVIAYATNLVVVLEAISITGSDSFLCQLSGAPLYTAIFYFGCRYFAFPKGAKNV